MQFADVSDPDDSFYTVLIPRGDDYYWFGEIEEPGDEVFDIDTETGLEVVYDESGAVIGFDLRFVDDTLLAQIR